MKTDLTANGANDRLGRHAVEERAQGGEAGADDAESGLNGRPKYDPVVMD